MNSTLVHAVVWACGNSSASNFTYASNYLTSSYLHIAFFSRAVGVPSPLPADKAQTRPLTSASWKDCTTWEVNAPQPPSLRHCSVLRKRHSHPFTFELSLDTFTPVYEFTNFARTVDRAIEVQIERYSPFRCTSWIAPFCSLEASSTSSHASCSTLLHLISLYPSYHHHSPCALTRCRKTQPLRPRPSVRA